MTLNIAGQPARIKTTLDADDVIPVQVYESDGVTPASIAEATVTGYVLDYRGVPLEDALITATGTILEAGFSNIGQAEVPIATADKRELLRVGTYYYMVLLAEVGGQVTTLRHGPFEIVA